MKKFRFVQASMLLPIILLAATSAFGQFWFPSSSSNGIYTTSNVGIGTSTPAYTLDVKGIANISGNTSGTTARMYLTSPNNNNKVTIGVHDNSVTEGGAFLWNEANTNLHFGTNNTERMRISASGNVGIGTNNPGYKLDVKGITNITNDGGPFSWESKLYLTSPNTNNKLSISILDNSAGNYASIINEANASLLLGTNKMARVKLSETGNLGIGVEGLADLTDRLYVNGNARINGTGSSARLYFNPPFNSNQLTIGIHNNSVLNGAAFMWNEANTDLLFGTAGVERMRILANGNVGVGTITPDKGKLHVKGSVHVENDNGTQLFHVSSSKQLVFVGDSAWIQYNASLSNPNSHIQQNEYSLWVSDGIVSEDYAVANIHEWDDYVFNENYELPALEEVAAFVRTNKHLPNIPSEAEIKKNGYSLHEMNRNFLKTIEELTLYTIEQGTRIKALEAEVCVQNNMLKQYENIALEIEKLKALVRELDKQDN